jgi:uncharacterized membrane protein
MQVYSVQTVRLLWMGTALFLAGSVVGLDFSYRLKINKSRFVKLCTRVL